MKLILIATTLLAVSAGAHPGDTSHLDKKPILADIKDLKALGIPVMAADPETGVGFTYITERSAEALSVRAHQSGKCGGFEVLPENLTSASISPHLEALQQLNRQVKRELILQSAPFRAVSVNRNAFIEAKVSEVSEDNLRAYVQWLSSFQNRFNKGPNANNHVFQMQDRLEGMLVQGQIPYKVELIDHKSTPQKTIRVTLPGSDKPNEVVVLGGHLDSINQSWGGNKDFAPGADDNASGSANLIEALRIISAGPQPKRTIEFYWYAGEESGLLGSGEIATEAKQKKKDVIGVLQLDMTLFPGSGEGTIASMTDFTSSWLRDYFVEINRVYLNANIVNDKCGYGCSDHASWFRQGYPTLMPFEAKTNAMNKNIHTVNDKISPQLNFKHSALYSKVAVIFALDLGNSDLRQPLMN